MTRDEFIQTYLAIDPASPTGLTWLGHPSKTHATRFTGKPAGNIDSNGRYQTQVQGKNLFNHRIVFFLHHGAWPVGEVDHIDGDRLNNRPDNLRDVTRSENEQNKLARGYCWHKRDRRWQARIKVNGKLHHLGLYPTEEEARAAYLNAKAQLHPAAPARCYG